MKSLKIVIIALLLIFSHVSFSRITAKSLNGKTIILEGSIAPRAIDPQIASSPASNSVRVETGLHVYRSLLNLDCSSGDSMIRDVNWELGHRIYVNIESAAHYSRTEARFLCSTHDQNDPTKHLIWQITEPIDSIDETMTTCSASAVNSEINFGTIKPNERSQTQTGKISVKCNQDASVSMKIKNTTRDNILMIDDARVTATFQNNLNTLKIDAYKYPREIPYNVTVQDAGSKSGVKSGALIIEASWL